MDNRRFDVLSIILLWASGDVSCYCVTRSVEHIDIVFSVDGSMVERLTFNKKRTAVDFAMAMMHTYENAEFVS